MITSGMMSSNTPEWSTPQYIVNWSSNRFQMGHPYVLDAAATFENKKAPCFFSEEHSALELKWNASRIWLNPPYGRIISKFTQRAIQQLQDPQIINSSVTLLLPARTDTKWFFDLIQNPLQKHIVFIKGRIAFGSGKSKAPFPSVLIHIESFDGPITTSYEVVQ